MYYKIFLVSACLLGAKTRYKGDCHRLWLSAFQKILPAAKENGIVFLPICPEQLGGLPTPRLPSELQDTAADVLSGKGRILSAMGDDVSLQFIRGAEAAVHFASVLGACGAILTEKSPSCGVRYVYSGSFDGRLVEGEGIATYALKQAGFKCISSDETANVIDITHGSPSVLFQKLDAL